MFGLTALEAKLIGALGLLVALGIGYGVWTHHERVIGEQKIEAADAKTLAAEIAKEQAAVNAASHSHDAEIASLNAYVAAHPVGSVQLCISTAPDSVPGTGAAGSPSSTAPSAGPVQPVPTSDPNVRTGPRPGPDIGSMLGALAERADEVSAQLRAVQGAIK